MDNLTTYLKGILTLDTATYERMRDSSDAMKKGIYIFVIAFLIAGSLQFVVSFVDNLQPFGPEEANEIKAQIEQQMTMMQQFAPPDEEGQFALDMMMDNLDAGLTIGSEIDSLETPLPRPIARFFQSFGAWLSRPFSRLAMWMFYGIWVLLFAKLLGGNGGIDRFLGVTALSSIPHVLAILGPIQCAGTLLALVGWVWAIAIYIKGVEVSQRFSFGKAALATFLPVLIVIGLAALFGIGGLGLLIVSAN
ncbi:MAG: Yip1 family protein [Chloroflexota bacterium]|nr:Yip1 family protein [Chloroflexota bacterium]